MIRSDSEIYNTQLTASGIPGVSLHITEAPMATKTLELQERLLAH
jgi:hypothetical protein